MLSSRWSSYILRQTFSIREKSIFMTEFFYFYVKNYFGNLLIKQKF
ncbi:hypothetical protein LEP1GSC133_2181 [Leptospira borgpetersenii serovar Pomona str. 200901868]|uniref:Uncharacterized protein n=1 Tax=Leptospira borgpetersenii serovar Pomona str. 200901868 TaxID=1192866 RepID=M6WNH0_LEPBO|nr:hypothetical protein LEP1GSC133_2181 [Leptospira borgpetersenii serovar Pomona str. 200901868]